MPYGLPYFAWIEPSETTFTGIHLRWDEEIISFDLGQEEGDPAHLTLVVKRPRNEAGDPVGLLGPDRKIWAWFGLDCGGDPANHLVIRARLVGVPTSVHKELVTLEFIARPIDVVIQKGQLADALKVLPGYDELVIDPSRRDDPEVVLEGYTKIWHYDRATHVMTVSDEISGEDGTLIFDGVSADGILLDEGLELNLTTGPLSRVDVHAEYTWTQQARGTVDLTQYILANWPQPHAANAILSLTLTADSWPKPGASLGDGWEVSDSSAVGGNAEVISKTIGGTQKTIFSDSSWFGPSTTSVTFSETTSRVDGDVAFQTAEIITSFNYSSSSAPDGPISDYGQATYTTSISQSWSAVAFAIALNNIVVTLQASYTANRQCTEVVEFSLFADIQHVLTDPEDGEMLRIPDIKSVNLSESIGEGIPIGDPARRSYIATERGNRSLEHLIVLARAHLLKRARVVEWTFAPQLSRMYEVTLRKNAYINDPRIGEAVGKIIRYSVSLDGNDGRIKCSITIGCTIGKGGEVEAVEGTGLYAVPEYAGPDYQQFIDRVVLLDTSVGYQPPLSDPNDDGLNFLSPLTAADVIEVGLAVENPYTVQMAHVGAPFFGTGLGTPGVTEEIVQEWLRIISESFNTTLKEVPTKATFKLKSMTREFSTPYVVQMTELKVPVGYDLEVV